MARAHGEGTIYETTQKIKRDFDNTNMCKVCSECADKSICNQRTNWNKCDKCKKCDGKDCDRFYIYKKTFAQISTKDGRKTLASGRNKKETNLKKEKNEEQLKLLENAKNGDLTLEETMKLNEKQKLENNDIIENTYNRNIETINTICSHRISKMKMIDISESDIKDAFKYFISSNSSQSQIDKNFDEINGAFKFCKLKTMEDIKRTSFLSNVEPEEVIAFTEEEEEKLLNYINSNEDKLVSSNKSKIDAKTVKNIIKFGLATGMRIGEICSLNKDESINKDLKKVIVRTTLTKDLDNKIIIGKNTKTGRKKRQARKKDIRYIPFGVLFDENEFIKILDEQYKVASSIPNNSSNLLFCTQTGNFIGHSSFNAIFKRICRQAGIKLELIDGCNTHMMKHTAVTRMIENGIRIEVISVIVGTSVEVLRKTYAHILDDFIESEIEKSIKNRNSNLSLA